jgi:hypothetical protein
MTCPSCHSKKILPIIYGEITEVVKNVYYGGCVVDEDSPSYYCSSCKNTWGKVALNEY